MRRTIKQLALATALLAASAAHAQATWSGWLCCSLRGDGKWISDINYDEGPTHRIIPAGTPVQITGYGRYRVLVTIDGKSQAIGNDYSRDLGLEAFARRYVLAEDPSATLASHPPKIREAIAAGKVTRGMTREQARMAVGWPVSSENPDPQAKVLRHWLSSFAEYQLVFDASGRISDINTDPATRNAVVVD
ncbi:hypothetical protein JI739_12935 [Ramlibacter sp. AW1]|uniref:PepSY domain-containing protein n=1 Tax=Ramlibacter aurantiacus TaxID=2801330 RepID=A0A936ZHZ6_9BURK|nr:hypothetical protein [Ramlibacter aurantiacus]MBL0421257.1 hypothetical protein [Ramlibacter aurantiacus]